MTKKTLISALFVIFVSSIPFTLRGAAGQEAYTILTYHSHPPFVIDKTSGLSFTLAQYLTQASKGKFLFNVKVASRPRVDVEIKKSQNAIIPWVNPAWFKDKEELKYQWSSSVLMTDSNSVVSRASDPIEFENVSVIEGRVFGGLKGHKYDLIDKYIASSKNARRVDADTHESNFKKLIKNRIDLMLIPESGARFYVKKLGLKNHVFISKKNQSSYQRRIMILSKDENLRNFLDTVIPKFSKTIRD